MKNKIKSLLKDTLIFALGSIGSKLILFLLVPLYTNYMTQSEYGTADLVFTMSQLISPFISLVIFDAVIRYGLSKFEKSEDVLLVSVIIFGFGSVVTILITPLFNYYSVIANWKWYLCVHIIVSNAHSISFNYLKAKGKNSLYSILSILLTAVAASLNIYFLVIRSMSIRGYLLAWIIAHASAALLAIIFGGIISDLRKARFDGDLMRRMVLYSAPLILNNVSWWVIHSSDKVMVELMISASALGLYTVAAKIPSLINVMINIFSQAWGISSVKEIESSNDTKFYSSVFRTYNLLTCGACICSVTIMKLFMRYYVGNSFIEAWKYVPLLLVSAVFAAVASFYGSLYGALKKSVNNMITTLVAAVTNIAVNFCFIPFVGIWGAVIGTLVSYIVIAFARMIDVGRYIKIPIDMKLFVFNSSVIILQAILVSIDFHIYPVSAIALGLFCFANREDLRSILILRKSI